MRQASASVLSRTKKKALLTSLDELEERMPSLLDIDHPCARKQIADARHFVKVEIYVFVKFSVHKLYHLTLELHGIQSCDIGDFLRIVQSVLIVLYSLPAIR